MSPRLWTAPLRGLLLLALAGAILGCAAQQHPDEALSPQERSQLEQRSAALDKDIAGLQRELAALKKAQGGHNAEIGRAERAAGLPTSSGVALSTGGLTAQPGQGTHLRLRLERATLELNPRFSGGSGRAELKIFPFNGAYSKQGAR